MTESRTQATQALIAEGAPFEVTEGVIRGIPTKMWKLAPSDLQAVFRATATHADKDYLVFEDERFTYRDIHRLVDEMIALLRHYGVDRGDRVVLAMRNYPEWVVTFWATLVMGAIIVPLNAWWTGPELEYGVIDSGAKIAVVDRERLSRLADHVDQIEHENGELQFITVRVAKEEIPANLADHVIRFEARPELGDQTPSDPPIEPDDDAAIFYTSGTTGKPKGAILTHRNIVSCLMNSLFSAARRNRMANSPHEPTSPKYPTAALLSVPLFHATGSFATLIPNSVVGGKIVLMYRWNPERALELIERERVTSFGGVPTMVWQVINSPDLATRDTSSVAAISYGGAPAAPELVRKIRQHFPTSTPTNGYGMTETSAIASLNVGDDYVRKPDSAGPPMPVVEARVVDERGEARGVGETGELWLKGPTVIRGYWNRPDATAATFTDGWLHTGDLAYLDDEGFIFIVDRAKDMLIRGGENVYSVEIEAALFEHPDVLDACVVGIPDMVLGEEVAAIIQLRPGANLDEDEVRHHVAERLAAFKVPRYVLFRDEPLPRNAAGKLLKRQIKDAVIEHEIEQPEH
jgi:long-chain acyl-CoA synthetase